MIQNVVTSIILYSGTAVDLLIILMLFFAKRKSRKDIINIYLGQFLGSVSLILLSLLFAFVLDYIPSKEILGLLGLIPIFLGLKVLLLGDSDGEAIAKEGLRKDNKNLIFLVAMITFASCGADNIGVFVPYFTTLNLVNLIVALLTFLVMIYLLVFSAQKLAQVPSVGETLEKYSRWFVAVVYLGLGVYILIENNSFDMLPSLCRYCFQTLSECRQSRHLECSQANEPVLHCNDNYYRKTSD
ncbi:cadmium resistance protein [Neisseria meningitidis]|nr:cadmium resistance protein [Neisseria meningitidis]